MEMETVPLLDTSDVDALIDRSLDEYPRDPDLDGISGYFKGRFGKAMRMVIFYGSRLSAVTASPDSILDFWVVVGDYRQVDCGLVTNVLNRILPPNQFHFDGMLGVGEGRRVRFKYYLISEGDFFAATSPKARDMYVFGRMSKRVGLVFCADAEVRRRLVAAIRWSMERVVDLALPLCEGTYDLDDLVREFLYLSYRSERRLETGNKAERLLAAAPDYYRQIFGHFLQARAASARVEILPDGRVRVLPATAWDRKRTLRFLDRSRRRARLRWPKMMLTVDDWVEILQAKLERSHGFRIEVPAWERPIVLLTGWRHYFRLRRAGKVR